MAESKSFSQFLAEARASRTLNAKPIKPSTFSDNLPARDKAEDDLDPLSRVISFLSAGLYAGSNIPNQVLNEQRKEFEARKAGEQYDVLGGIGNVVSSPFRGFWAGITGTSPEDKKSYAQIFEKAEDVNNLGNPRYKDVENNLKANEAAAIGLGLDIALDPLTYVPIVGLSAKGGQLAARAGKAVKGAVKGDQSAAAKRLRSQQNLEAEANVLRTGSSTVDNVADDASTEVLPATTVEAVVEKKPRKASEAVDKKLAEVDAAELAARTETVDENVGKLADELADDMAKPTQATVPTADELLTQLPKSEGGLTVPQRLAAELQRVRKGNRVTEDERVKWVKNTREILQKREQAGPLSPREQEVLDGINSGRSQKKYFMDYMAQANRYGRDKVDVTGDVLGRRNPREWFEFKARTSNEAVGKIGKQLIKPKEALEIAAKGTLNGTKLSKAELAEFGKSVDEALKIDLEDMRAALKEESGSFSANVLKQLRTESTSKDWQNLLGADMYRRWTDPKLKPEKLEAEAQLLEDIGLGKRVLADVRNIDEEVMATAMKNYTDFLFGERTGWTGIADYNAMQRQATSNVYDEVARESIAAAKKGDFVALATLVGTPTEEIDFFAKTFGKWAEKRIELSKLPFETTTGAKRASDVTGEGATFRKEINSFDMWDLFYDLLKASFDDVAKFGLSGQRRADALFGRTMRGLAYAEKSLDALGVPMWTGIPRTGTRFLLSPTQMMSRLNEIDPEIVRMMFFNGGTRVPFTFVAEAVSETLMRGKSLPLDDLKAILRGDVDKAYSERIKRVTPTDEKATFNAFKQEKGKTYPYGYGEKGKIQQFTGDQMVDRFAAALDEALPGLRDDIATNSTIFKTRFRREAADLTKKQLDTLRQLAESPKNVGAVMQASANLSKRVMTDAAESGALDLSALRAAEQLELAIPKPAVQIAKAAEKGTKAASKTMKEATKPRSKKTPAQVANDLDEVSKKSESEILAPATKAAREYTETAAKSSPELATASKENIDSAAAYMEVEAGRAAILAPLSPVWDFFASKFSRFNNMERVANPAHGISNAMGYYRLPYLNKLGELAKKYGGPAADGGPSVLVRIFSDIQKGADPTPGFEDVFKELEDLVAQVHDVTRVGGLMDDPMLRNTQGIEYINAALKDAEIGEALHFDLKRALADVKRSKTGLTLEEALSRQWRDFTIEDVPDYLARRQAALLSIATDLSTARAVEDLALRTGGILDAAAPGYMKPKGLQGKYFRFLDQDKYYDASLLEELKYLQKYTDESRQNKLKFIRQYYMPIQDFWKSAVTIYRPGHHLRNAGGSASITYLSEGVSKGRFAKAFNEGIKILAYKNKYDGVDLLNALYKRGQSSAGLGGEVLYRIDGEELTTGWAYDAMARTGLLPTYSVAEDLIEGGTKTKFTDIMDVASLKGTKVQKFAGGVSEAIDHGARAHQFALILGRNQNNVGKGKQFATTEDLVQFAADRVKKNHPDSRMMTPFEARNMRTAVPFYGWFRGVLPALAENLMLYPGRFMVVPKASFNLAYAMGVNPDSLYDPFPDDQAFPSFLKEQVTGPVFNIGGNYLGMNPGAVNVDVPNTLSQGVGGLIGMTSPLVRTPIELLSGTQLATGSRIKDYSDYVDSQLPGVNYLANISGTSATGSLFSMLQGKGLDPQLQVEQGNKTESDQALSLINWLLGIGLSNQSKPNFINYAEIEERNKAAKEASTRSAY